MSARSRIAVLGACSLLFSACGGTQRADPASVTIAAAANLTGVMDDIARAFERETSARVVVSYGSTAQLAQQIEHGAPFDVFAAADTEHIDALIERGKLQRESRAIYARGQLVLWSPNPALRVGSLEDLTQPRVRFIAIAQPRLAPYGRAAVEALKAAGVWDRIQSKVTYANSISMAKQYASSANADVAFTALSLVLKEGHGAAIRIDPRLYRPLDQALAITTMARHGELARRFAQFLLGKSGRSVFAKNGYLLP
ncbi:MAG TPA: molybdate ABC transporter substrate-binding protein [Bryobacteraceae bacterium]|nr:molybdate ABC transporter substrate-binding protein [Bryobacteraceae bacterium]